MMRKAFVVLTVMLLGLGSAALGQDSVSIPQVLPGDAVSPYSTSEQLNTYTVELARVYSSWGTKWGLAPLIKSSKSDANFFSSLISAHAMSNILISKRGCLNNSYMSWNAPGYGVNNDPILNTPGATINIAPLSDYFDVNQFGAVIAEYGGTNYNGLVGAIANYLPEDPGTLYVSRIVAAINGTDIDTSHAAFGIGGVDASGNVYFRADPFGATGTPVVGQNIFRVDMLKRNTSVLNIISGNLAGTADLPATDHLVSGAASVHNTPTCIPEYLAAHPCYIGSNFNGDYAYEEFPTIVNYTNTHRGIIADHRGGVYYSHKKMFGNTTGTGCMLGQREGLNTTTILCWGVDNDGDVVPGTQVFLDIPVTITDNYDATVVPDIVASIHHDSQTAFRGGNGQVAFGKDQLGWCVVSCAMALVNGSPPSDNPFNVMVVGRFDPSNPSATITWTLATYYDIVNAKGKPILNGPGGSLIGRTARMDEVTGGAPLGPSMSCPCIDSVGNVWFFCSIRRGTDAQPPEEWDFDTALLRAVYNPVTFHYELEEVVEVGWIYNGQNSNRRYMVTFMGIADSNSISSGTMFSSNICQSSFNNMNVANLPTSDPRTLGGLVFSAEITYDADDDGDFDTALPGDEDYNCLMYLGNINPSKGTTAPTAGDQAGAPPPPPTKRKR